MRTKTFAFQLFALFVIAATLLSACGGSLLLLLQTTRTWLLASPKIL